jgi:hypothetical protein
VRGDLTLTRWVAIFVMSFSYQFGANPQIDYPRLMVGDTDSTKPIFDDLEILSAYQIDQAVCFPAVSTLVSQTWGTPSYRRAAAVLLDALAANKARLSAALEVLDIKIDAGKAAIQLRASAQQLRDTEADSGIFAIAEQYNDQFSGRERIWKQLLRIYAA